MLFQAKFSCWQQDQENKKRSMLMPLIKYTTTNKAVNKQEHYKKLWYSWSLIILRYFQLDKSHNSNLILM